MLPSREPVPFIFFFFLSFLFYNEIPTKMAQKWYTRNENCRKPGTRLSYSRKEFLNFRKLHKEKKNRRQISKNINTMIDLLQHSLRKSHTFVFIRNADTFFFSHLRESMRISKEMWPRTLSAFSRYYLTFGISYLGGFLPPVSIGVDPSSILIDSAFLPDFNSLWSFALARNINLRERVATVCLIWHGTASSPK